MLFQEMVIDLENPDKFQKLNVVNTGVNARENQKVEIAVISDSKKKSDYVYMHMKSNSVIDNFSTLTGETCPFSSIDVVFNKRNIWFNRQHFNPAVVKFDL